MFSASTAFALAIAAMVHIASFVRMRQATQQYMRERRAIILIQGWARCKMGKASFTEQLNASVRIQSRIRLRLAGHAYQQARRAMTKIQSMVRMVESVMLVQRTLMRKRNWQMFMEPHELLVLSGLTVKHDKGGGVFSSGRKRVQLILTSKKRFVVVNPAKMEMKGEIWMDGDAARVTLGGDGGQEGKSFTIHGASESTRGSGSGDAGTAKSPRRRSSSGAGKSPMKRGSISADGTESIMFTDLLGNAQRHVHTHSIRIAPH
jgi:hypothetical protein